MTNVKICGLTDLGDARHAVDLGAWAIGLIFHPDSPRACDREVGEEIGATLRRRTLVTGVFVNSTLDEIADTAERCSLGLLQLHGDEGPAFCSEAARRTGCRVMKAVPVRDAAAIRTLAPFRVDYHLLDAHSPDLRGGTGETFDWELAARADRTPPVVLSGGLDAENVSSAIAIARPFAVDTASGTESRPGRKDRRKVEAFFRAVAAADEADQQPEPPRAEANPARAPARSPS